MMGSSLPPQQVLLDHGIITICVGGGGIPVARAESGGVLRGVEAVIDKVPPARLLMWTMSAQLNVL